MGSERRPYQCKYWNLRPVVMPECSLIATRNSHAKHNKSVGRIPEHRQAKDYYAKDYKRSCFGSEIKGRNSRNLTVCTNTHDRLKVRNTSRICQKTIKPLSMRWTPTNKSCTTKPQNEKWEEATFLQICNLQSVVMSDCSLIATRNSHAKHNQSVGRIPEVRERDMGWCTHVSADKRDISFWIFSSTEA